MPIYTPNPTAVLWPTNFQGCKITGDFLWNDGTPVSGTVTLAPTVASVHDLGNGVTIESRPITLPLDAFGRITELDGTTLGRIVPATDDPDVQERGWTYTVTYSWKPFTHSITALQNTTLDLSTVPSVASAPGVVNLYTINPVVTTIPYAATVTPAVGSGSAGIIYNIGALSGPITIANPTGSPTDGQNLRLRLAQDGTGGRAMTFGTNYLFGTDVPLTAIPTAAATQWEMLFTYNAGDFTWRCVAIVRGFAGAATPTSGGSSSGTAPASPPTAGTPAGQTLTPMTGTTITTANTVLDGMDITGNVTINATGVVIKNSRITGTTGNGIRVLSGSLTVQDTTISGFQNGIIGDNWTLTRVELTALQDDGCKLGSNVTLDACYLHDFTPEAGAHSDGCQMEAGSTNITIKNSWIDPSTATNFSNSAIIIKNDFGPATTGPLQILNNHLGGGNYSLYIIATANAVSGVTVTSNRFARNAQYGAADVTLSGVAWSDNAYADNGQVIAG